jgi:polysaccharide export outer membrane protein
MLNSKRLGVLLSGLILATASVYGQNNPNVGSTPASQPVNVPAPSASQVDASATAKAVDHKAYEIGAQDILRIEVWQSNEFSRQVAVRPDGKFSMPLIGDVQAEGLSPERLESQLEEALAAYIMMPDVTVSVLQVNSKSYRVSGWVGRPGTYPLITPIRIYEAIADAGGFREYANKKKVVIVRGPTKRIEFNAEDYRKGKNPEKNILVENGDIIEVTD